MPLPKPKKDEDKESFMDRCMADDIMNEEYSDNDQRYAVCNSLWEDKKSMNDKIKKNSIEIERRFFSAQDGSEIRVIRSDKEPLKIVGYFAKFNKLSSNLGWFREIIEPGFFSDALKRSDCDPADLFNHDANFIMGRVSSKTLRVWEDDIGLAYECIPPDTQIIKDLVITPIERGDIKGCSFGFIIKGNGDMWDEDEEGRLIRTLKKDGCSELFDGSQVVFPAYPDTDIALRSMEGWKKNIEERNKKEQEAKDKVLKEMEQKKLQDAAYKNGILRKRLDNKIKSIV